MKHVSWIVALVVGAAIGWTVRSAMGGPAEGPRVVAPQFAPSAAPAQRPRPAIAQTVMRVPLEDSPVRGPADALVTIVVSSDFQCPFCKRGFATMKQVEEAYRGKVRVVFKHNPLPMHPRAVPAALAAEEARVQGGDAKFWAMHDKLFEAAPSLDDATIERLAGELGLDVAKVKEAMASGKGRDRLERDQKLANSLGAQGTPAFWVNGRFIYGAMPFETFQQVIDEEVKKAQALIEAGTPAAQVYEKIQAAAVAAPPPPPTAAAPAPSAALPAGALTIRPDDPVKGNPKAPVTMVIFSDFQCPFCSRVEPTLAQVEKTYGDKVRFVWKHQPLPMHSQAVPAALAAEAARQQGKFWQMHDKLFANQRALSDEVYDQYAKELGLDLAKFEAARKDPAVQARIQQDSQLGNSVGAGGTPTMFVNGEKVVGAVPFEAFQAVIDRQLASAAKAP